jgi:hypothetical protein
VPAIAMAVKRKPFNNKLGNNLSGVATAPYMIAANPTTIRTMLKIFVFPPNV